jgi:hypothetical protein
MKKIILSLMLGALSLPASADWILGVTPGVVGVENLGSTVVFVGLTVNTPSCVNGGIYFSGVNIDDRKAILGVAMAGKLAANTVRIEYTQPGGPGTICRGASIYLE